MPASPLTQTLIVKHQTHPDQIRHDFRSPNFTFCHFVPPIVPTHSVQLTHPPCSLSDDTLPGAIFIIIMSKSAEEGKDQLKRGLKLIELQRLTCRAMKRTHMQLLHRGQRCMAWTAAHSLRPALLSLSPAASAASHALPTNVRVSHNPPQPVLNVSCGLPNALIVNADV